MGTQLSAVDKMKLKLIIIDVIIFICISIIAIIIKYGGIEPYHRGFYCYDSSIKYPYHSSTVSSELALAISVVVPCLYITASEVYIFIQKNLSLSKLNSNIYKVSRMFLYGAATTGLLTSIGKLTVGRLRPHFISVCEPSISFNQTSCGSLQDPVYVEHFQCNGQDLSKIHDARLSFPSGHSSAAFYSMIFTAAYLHVRKLSASPLIIINQIVLVCYAWFCALTRVSDYKHHPTDVLAGAVLGTILALTVITMMKDKKKTRVEDIETNNNSKQQARDETGE